MRLPYTIISGQMHCFPYGKVFTCAFEAFLCLPCAQASMILTGFKCFSLLTIFCLLIQYSARDISSFALEIADRIPDLASFPWLRKSVELTLYRRHPEYTLQLKSNSAHSRSRVKVGMFTYIFGAYPVVFPILESSDSWFRVPSPGFPTIMAGRNRDCYCSACNVEEFLLEKEIHTRMVFGGWTDTCSFLHRRQRPYLQHHRTQLWKYFKADGSVVAPASPAVYFQKIIYLIALCTGLSMLENRQLLRPC